MKAIVEKPFKGAPDGQIYPRDFAKGDTVHGDLARVAVEQKWATETAPDLLSLGEKDAGSAPENKALGAAPENKTDPLDHDGDGRKGGSKPKNPRK